MIVYLSKTSIFSDRSCFEWETPAKLAGVIFYSNYGSVSSRKGNCTRELKMKRRILVADDELVWRERIGAVLDVFEVEFADSARAALLQIKRTKFDLLVLDNWMEKPGAGAELLHLLRERGETVPIIICSSDFPVITEEQVKQDGGIFVRKSYNGPGNLKAVVEKLLS